MNRKLLVLLATAASLGLAAATTYSASNIDTDASTSNFGTSVDLWTDMLVVGAPFRSSEAGAAYVFERTDDSTGLAQRAILSPTRAAAAAQDTFGTQVSIVWDNLVAVGDPSSGHAFVFKKDASNTSWYQISELSTTTLGTSTTQMALGAAAGTDAANAYLALVSTTANAVTVLELAGNGTATGASATIAGPAAADNLKLGTAVQFSLDAGKMVVGAQGDYDDANDVYERAGAVYVYTRSGATFTQSAVIDPPADAGAAGLFGAAVAIDPSGTIIAASSPTEDAVYVYKYANAEWTLDVKITAELESQLTYTRVVFACESVLVIGDSAGAFPNDDDSTAAVVIVKKGDDGSFARHSYHEPASASSSLGDDIAVAKSGEHTDLVVAGDVTNQLIEFVKVFDGAGEFGDDHSHSHDDHGAGAAHSLRPFVALMTLLGGAALLL